MTSRTKRLRKSEPDVSRRHAVLRGGERGWFLVVVLVGLGFAPIPTSAESINRQDAPIDGISRAYDGDGLYVDGVKIRLWGIDAPELGTPEGEASFAALASIDGRAVRCAPPPRETSYPVSGNRLVALCQLVATGLDVARLQVIGGHAVDWPKFSRGYYAEP